VLDVLGLDETTVQNALNAVNPNFQFGTSSLQELLAYYNNVFPISADLIFKFPVYYRQLLTNIEIKNDRFKVNDDVNADEFSKMLLSGPRPYIDGTEADTTQYSPNAQAALNGARNYLEY